MGLFRKRKVERPKSPLGNALFQYDNIMKRDLSKIVNRMLEQKSVNPKKADIIYKNICGKFDAIARDISRENLKVDYRSDKIRYMIVDIMSKVRILFNTAREHDFDQLKMKEYKVVSTWNGIVNLREIIKGKMKDIESDYL